MGHVNVDVVLRDETGAGAPRTILLDNGATEVAPKGYVPKQGHSAQTLESLGLKPNPDTGKLEPTRPKGVAYFYLLY